MAVGERAAPFWSSPIDRIPGSVSAVSTRAASWRIDHEQRDRARRCCRRTRAPAHLARGGDSGTRVPTTCRRRAARAARLPRRAELDVRTIASRLEGADRRHACTGVQARMCAAAGDPDETPARRKLRAGMDSHKTLEPTSDTSQADFRPPSMAAIAELQKKAPERGLFRLLCGQLLILPAQPHSSKGEQARAEKEQ